MPHLSKVSRWLLVAGLALDVGCGTWLGNPKNPDPDKSKPTGNSMVALRITSAAESAGLRLGEDSVAVLGRAGAVIGSLRVTAARLALSEIRLKTGDGDESERQEFAGPFVVDLVADSVRPDLGTIEVPNGVYRQIALKLEKLEPDRADGVVAEGDPLINRSIVLTGVYTPTGGSPATVTMDFELGEKFVLGGSASYAGMEIVEGQTNSVIVAFHLDEWFDFSGAEADLDDVGGSAIVLAKGSEDKMTEAGKKVREVIKENIKASARFGKDGDGDGKLGDHEGSDR